MICVGANSFQSKNACHDNVTNEREVYAVHNDAFKQHSSVQSLNDNILNSWQYPQRKVDARDARRGRDGVKLLTVFIYHVFIILLQFLKCVMSLESAKEQKSTDDEEMKNKTNEINEVKTKWDYSTWFWSKKKYIQQLHWEQNDVWIGFG